MNTSLSQIQHLVVSAALVTGAFEWASAHESEKGVEVTPVRMEKLAHVPGQALTAVRVTYAPGSKSAGHRHAGSVFAYVLSGAIRSENSATGPARIYPAGESFFEPAGSEHLVSENASATEPASLLAVFVAPEGATLTTFKEDASSASVDPELARQIFETMIQVPLSRPGYRPVHAKGIVCEGVFVPSTEASALSRAAHFHGTSVPVTVRFSDGSPNPAIPEYAPDAGPRGMAIRFRLPNGEKTDIVSMSHHGFVVGTGAELLALEQAIVATDPSKPHPWPVELFVSARPAALKFVQESAVLPASFATVAFFSNDAFVFVNQDGVKRAGRYQILPVAGRHDLSEAEAKAQPPNFLLEELKTRLAAGPVEYRLVVQLPNSGDSTKDPSVVWPDDRKTVSLGTIRVQSVNADSAGAEKALAFDPARLTDGIELSDDPLPALRASVYALSARHRHQQGFGQR